MKIGLVSVYNHNYGSMLQTYAIQTTLKKLGHEPEIIKYKKRRGLKQLLRVFNLPLVVMKGRVVYRDLYCKLFKSDLAKKLRIRAKEFEDFKNDNFLTTRQYIGWDDLITVNDKYDVFMIGSDQVWNPVNIGTDFYNLIFTSDEKYRIAYGSSFGVSRIPKTQVNKTKYYLSRIQELSTREQKGVEIIKTLTGRKATLVCDPTLLLEKKIWNEFKGNNRVITEKYVFCYFLGNNPSQRAFAKKISNLTGLKIVALQHLDEFIQSDEKFGDIKPYDINPKKFVNLIANAEYILTDSFHGSIFSVIFEKNFYTFSRFEDSASTSTNSRIESLLNLLNIKGRYIKASIEVNDVLLNNMDYTGVEGRIQDLRNYSLNYLITALKKADIYGENRR